jgi:hypothetical protein
MVLIRRKVWGILKVRTVLCTKLMRTIREKVGGPYGLELQINEGELRSKVLRGGARNGEERKQRSPGGDSLFESPAKQ